jgi:hypothetical protein
MQEPSDDQVSSHTNQILKQSSWQQLARKRGLTSLPTDSMKRQKSTVRALFRARQSGTKTAAKKRKAGAL